MSIENEITALENEYEISEDIEEIPIRKERSRERGPDRQPRKLNSVALHNLKQYRDIPQEQFCVPDTGKLKKVFLFVVVLLGLITLSIIMLDWHEKRKIKEEIETVNPNG